MDWHQIFTIASPLEREEISLLLLEAVGELAQNETKGILGKFAALPLPVRMGIIHSIVIGMAIFAFPPPDDLPPISIPLVWIGSYCFTLMLVSILKIPMGSKVAS